MDFLPTKGIEYLMVIGYLLLLIPAWWMLRRGASPSAATAVAPARRATPGLRGWFRVPEGVLFHPGHTWAVPELGHLLKVGVDDFAQLLVGPPESIRLPAAGSALEIGERGWSFGADGKSVDLLSPVAGEVVEVNPEVIEDPSLVSRDPYGKGWLLKVRPDRPGSAFKNLMPGKIAGEWMESSAEALSAMMGRQLGTVLQDGGVPVAGLARQIDPDAWERVAAELLLTAR